MPSLFLRAVTEIMVLGDWFVAGEILLGVEFPQQRPLRLYLRVLFLWPKHLSLSLSVIWIFCFARSF